MYSGGFIAEEVDGAGDKGSGDTRMADGQRLLEAFLKMSLRSACLTDETFLLVKEAKLPVLGLLSSSARSSGFLNYWTSD